MSEKQIYIDALLMFGAEAQCRMVQEECAELIAVINRWHRQRCDRDEVASEVADVEIMCAQMRLLVGDSAIDAAKADKLNRLRDRITVRFSAASPAPGKDKEQSK